MSSRFVAICLAVTLGLPIVSLAADDAVVALDALVIGPFPAAPALVATPHVPGDQELVPEIDPTGWMPEEGDKVPAAPGHELTWRKVGAADGGFALPDSGVYWLAARLQSDRWSEVTLKADGGCAIYADGTKVAANVPGEPGDDVEGDVGAGTGARFVFVRASAGKDGGHVTLSATGDATLSWTLDAQLGLSGIDRARRIAMIGNLAVSPKGALVARRLSRRKPTGEGWQRDVSVFASDGGLVASDLGGAGARPEAFSPDGRQLLLRRSDGGNTDLVLWTAPLGPVRTVVEDEPGLGIVRFSPDGHWLLIASTRGFDAKSVAEDQAHRWDTLGQRLTDWDPLTHLHLVNVATGARRVLTQPGDWTLDGAAWLPDGKAIIYGRTQPQPERPWFTSEIHRIDLATGDDTVVATFTGGWEVRPQAFAPHPDGRRVAFLGPPEAVGDGHTEHNVYDKQVWMLDLATGKTERATYGLRDTFAGGGGLPAWEPRGRWLVVPATAGSRDVLVQLEPDGAHWKATEVATEGVTGEGWALSPDAVAVAYTASGLAQPPSLCLQTLGGRARVIEAPNAALTQRWRLAATSDASFTGPGGETIEAWWYRPSTAAAGVFDQPAQGNAGSVPLIVYYYGGASPTIRGFNPTHQFWAANGYAVLVINPRGAFGYGDAFADAHAGDWGTEAGADIVAGTEALLARFPQLDRKAVGCYGGSYGGFMTMYLVSHSDLFAAAVAMYGIADLVTYWGQGAWGITYGDMALGGRTPWGDASYFTQHSPVYAADRIHTPLLMLHGASDTNVTPGNSEEMFAALKVLGRDVDMVTFPGENHGIAGTWADYTGHRTMMLEFFDRWLKQQPQAWEHRWK